MSNFDPTRVEEDIGKMVEGGRTDAEVVAREEEAIKIDSLSVAQLKEIREKADKHVFQVRCGPSLQKHQQCNHSLSFDVSFAACTA